MQQKTLLVTDVEMEFQHKLGIARSTLELPH